MDAKTSGRIIDLSMKWQSKTEWTLAYKAANSFRHHKRKAREEWAIARKMRDDGQQGDMLATFEREAARNEELAETYHGRVIDAHASLIELENLVRSHAPTLLELVPVADFFEAVEVDLSAAMKSLRKLEGEILAGGSDGPLLVTLNQMSWLLTGTPSVSRMRNKATDHPLPKPAKSGNGREHVYLYTDLAQWVRTHFPKANVQDEQQAQADLLKRV